MCCYLFILREYLKDLYSTESSQKLFLLKKSMPLFAQEILEGSIFNVGVTALLARLGIVSFSAYSVCRRLVDLCLTPMFMYCNGVIVLTGEYIAEKNKKKLLYKLNKIITLHSHAETVNDILPLLVYPNEEL